MSKKRTRTKQAPRAEPMQARSAGSAAFFCDASKFDDLACRGYIKLSDSPEISAAVDTIAQLVGSQTIHLMQNTERGDIRVTNALSRKVDIDPNKNMTRSNFIRWIVRTMYYSGNAVAWPRTRVGYLDDLIPIPPAFTSFVPYGDFDYRVVIAGREYEPDNVLHFALNPGEYYPWLGVGYQIQLSDVANNLKQAATTEKGFMSSKWKPSIIVKVDGLVDEFSSPEGREKLLNSYAASGEAGEPWLIPANQFEVEQVKPLTLSDLALADFVKLDKRTVASILGVPPFVLGEGEFKRDAWNAFINSRIMPLSQNIQQVLTKGLLYSPDMYFRFNPRSLYNYDLKDLAAVADDQYIRGIVTGNEVRDWLGLTPLEGLDILTILPYIGLGFIVRYMSDGVTSYSPVVLTKLRTTASSEDYSTQEEEIDWQTKELEMSIYRDDSTKHRWKRVADDQESEDAAEACIKAMLNYTEPGG